MKLFYEIHRGFVYCGMLRREGTDDQFYDLSILLTSNCEHQISLKTAGSMDNAKSAVEKYIDENIRKS